MGKLGIDQEDLATAINGDAPSERTKAIRRLILEAWVRGWNDHAKITGGRPLDPEQMAEEREFGLL
jgi:hypothetical protein